MLKIFAIVVPAAEELAEKREFQLKLWTAPHSAIRIIIISSVKKTGRLLTCVMPTKQVATIGISAIISGQKRLII